MSVGSCPSSAITCVKTEHLTRFQGLLPEGQGQILAVTVVYVPSLPKQRHHLAGEDSASLGRIQGYLAYKKTHSPRSTLRASIARQLEEQRISWKDKA